MSRISDLLRPASIALVGAAEGSLWTQAIWSNLKNLGYGGSVIPVHPRHSEVFGEKCYPSLLDVPGEVGCAYVMTGTGAAEGIIEDCGRRGVRSAVMLTSGFGETGSEGAVLEARLAERARALGIALMGPNCLGFVNYHDRVPAYALTLAPPLTAGPIALISQSGAMLLYFHRMALQRGHGIAYSVSIGNQAVLAASDFISTFVADPRVKVVGALIEGIRDGQAFLRAADLALEAGKPLVVLKVGRSEVGERSVAAHTGSLAGRDAVTDAVFRQKAVIRVGGLEELIETCALLAARGWPPGGRTAVVTTSGGACGLISDLAVGTRVEMPDYDDTVKARLREVLPVFGTAQNPLDTTGVIVNQPGMLGACIDAVAAGEGYDALLVNTDVPREPGPNPASIEERMAALDAALARFPRFSMIASSAAIDVSDFGREVLARHRLHFANGLSLGVRALDHAIFYGQARQGALRAVRSGVAVASEVGPPPLVDGWSGPVGEVLSKRLLEAYGIAIPDEWVAASAEEAAQAAAQIGFPVVLKLVSPDILHKTEAGGVRLELASDDAVRTAYDEILAAAQTHRPGARVEGVLVVRQVVPLLELILGVQHDPVFGPVVLAGLGGIFVETMGDVSMRLPPLDREQALAMLRELRGYPLLVGARGRPAADLAAVAEALVGLGRLALDLGPRLRSLDVNPLFVMPEGAGVLAGDAMAVLS